MQRDEGRAGCGTGAAPDCRFLPGYMHAAKQSQSNGNGV